MVRYNDECIGCGAICLSYCPYRKVPHCYCDKCGEEIFGDIFSGTIAGCHYEDLCEDCYEKTEEFEIRLDEYMEEENEDADQ